MSEAERSMAFDCPDCGTTNPIYGEPSDFEGRVFSCEGCGENVLLGSHRDEPPASETTGTDRDGGSE